MERLPSLMRKWIAMCDMDRKEAAKRLCVSKSSIDHWISGKTVPKNTTLRYIMDIMKLDMNSAVERWNNNLRKASEEAMRRD